MIRVQTWSTRAWFCTSQWYWPLRKLVILWGGQSGKCWAMEVAGSTLGINSSQGTVHLASQTQPGYYQVIHKRNNPLTPLSIKLMTQNFTTDNTYCVIVWFYNLWCWCCTFKNYRSMPGNWKEYKVDAIDSPLVHPPVYRLVPDDRFCMWNLKFQRTNSWPSSLFARKLCFITEHYLNNSLSCFLT